MRLETVRRRRIVALLAAVAVVALVAGVLAASGGSSGPPIATDAAKLVPSNALVYVHLSTDPRRDAVGAARRLASRFSSYERLRAAVLARLSVNGSGAQIGSWLGREMALALVGSSDGTAGSLVLLAVRDEARAKAFVARGARQSGPSQAYRGVRIDRYGAVNAAFVGRFLVLGQATTLRQAIDLGQGRGGALSSDPTYARLTGRLPGDRVADAYATADGLRRLLVPAGGALGVAGVVLDRPNLRGVALSVSADGPGARMTIESDVPGRKGAPFDPRLLDAVPRGAMAYFGTKGLDQTVTRLLAAGGTPALGRLLGSVPGALGARGALDVKANLLDLLRGETAVAILPGIPRPTLLVLARTKDVARTRAALARLTASLPKLLKGARVSTAGDVTVVRSSTTEVDAAVIDGKLVISTGMAGIDAARQPAGGIGGADAFKAVAGSGGPVTSIVFLDFSQLLRIGEQTGLNDSRAYLAVKGDLGRVRAIGARSTGTGEDTTSEIRLQIP